MERRTTVRSAWLDFITCLGLIFLATFAQVSHAQTSYYGPPYNGYSTLSAAVNYDAAPFYAELGKDPAMGLDCIHHSCAVTIKYLDPSKNGGTAAQIFFSYDGQRSQYPTTILATSKNYNVLKILGDPSSCACTSGVGGRTGGSSPHGGSGDASLDSHPSGPFTVGEGDPINVATGNKFEQDTDFRSSDWLTFRRFYNSSSNVATSHLGSQWRHTFDRSLEIVRIEQGTAGSSYVYLDRPDGSRQHFVLSNGLWTADSDNPNRLIEHDDASGNPQYYTVALADPRSTETYDAMGLLQSITDSSGEITALTYSNASTPVTVAPAPGLLLTVTSPQGRALNFTYNGNGQIQAVTLPDGGTLTYVYDPNSGMLLSVKYPDGKTRQYVYNEPSLTGTNSASMPAALTGVVDEAGVRYETTGYSYYNNGAAVSSTFAVGADATTLSPGNQSASFTTPLGKYVTLNFVESAGTLKPDGSGAYCGLQCNQTNQSYSYDSNGYLSSVTDWKGFVTKTTYDTNGLLDQQIDASGTSSQRTTTTTWNTTLRVPLTRTVQNASGTTVSSNQWVYNTLGQTLARCEIDPANSAATGYACSTTGTVPDGVRRWTYTYCATVDTVQCPLVSLLLTATGPRTDLTQTTTYGYYLTSSAMNCGTPGAACYQIGDLHTITDPLGHVTTFVSYDADGRFTRETDANGINTDMTYTPRGWLASHTVGGAQTTFGYKPYGAVSSVADPDGVTTTYGYDAAHRLITIIDAQGNYVQYTLDAAGDKTAEKVFDNSGGVHKSLSRTFNTLGQLTSVVDGLNKTVFSASASGSYDANGNLVQSGDGRGIQRQSRYDPLNRLVKTLDNYNGTDPATQNTTTQYSYDPLDRLIQVTDPNNLATSYGYDGLSDATGQISPDTGVTSRIYDAAGNVLSRTDANNITATNTYDALDRLASTSYVDSTQNVAYHYDEANGVTGCSSSYPVGHLTRIVESTVTTVYCYDAQGQVIEKQQTTGTATATTGYAYTTAGRLSGVLYPSGTLATYARDSGGRIQSVSITPSNGTSSIAVNNVSYLPFGPVSSYTLGNGQTIIRTYDANYRLTDLTSPAFNLHVTQDPVGDITAIGNAPGANPATETYKYDPLDRLTTFTEANGTALQSVTYNQTGDRLSKTGSGLATGTYQYNTSTHQLTAVGSYARTVDANGNTTAITTATGNLGFGYNARNRLVVAQITGNTVGAYTYDALGERILKVAGTANQRYSYGEEQELLSEQGTANRDYVWMGGIPVANVDTSGTASTIAYVTADQLGTPRAISNGSGATIWAWPYAGNAWGESAPTSSGYVYNLRFPGQYFDVETGLSYNVNRDYDATTGWYLQSDPLGMFGGQTSTYAYVGGDPLNRTDPTGLRCNGQGCWNTPQESAYAAAGDWKNYYATACAGGDTYACEGSNVANNVGTLSGITNYRLASLISDHLPLGKTCAADSAVIAQKMEAIREALVAARVRQLAGATPDNPMIVSGKSISDFHNAIFRKIAGGSTSSWGIPVFGGDLPFSNKMVHWCTSPTCHP